MTLLPIPIMDFARAVQFVRYKAEEWGLDKDRVAFLGMSAGAASALWLGLHDDLADPENEDPVLRQSTKPICVLARSGQTFIDARMVKRYVGRPAMTRMIWQTVGAKSPEDALERYEEFEHLYTKYSAYNHLDKDDPPVLLYYKTDMNDEGTHSARYGAKLLERAEEVGATVYLSSPDHPVGESFPYNGQWAFVYDQLLETKLESDVDETENRAE